MITSQRIQKHMMKTHGIKKYQAVKLTMALLNFFQEELLKGNDIYFKEIGTLLVVKKPAKTMLVCGMEKQIPERLLIKFRPTKNFNKKLKKKQK